MGTNVEHPLGLPAPTEWWTQQKGHASAEQFNAWIASKSGQKGNGRRGKFNANKGFRQSLGYSVNSSLENDMACLLVFTGYQRWTEPYPSTPPLDGLWYRFEGQEFLLADSKGKTSGYKPDWHIWENGRYRLVETKGHIDQRSKRHDRLMRQQHPEIPLELITRPILEQMKTAALYAARRRNGNGEPMDIPGWEG